MPSTAPAPVLTPAPAAPARPLLGLLLLTANLRAAITCVAPLLDRVRAAHGLNGAALSLLTTLPVLCLGLFAPLAPALARRYGTEVTVAGALFVLAAGILLRSAPSTAALYAGTVLIGAGIATGNVLVPAIVKHQHPDRIGHRTGLAMTVMSTTAALAAALAVPLAEATTWQAALALWSVPALLAATAWAHLARRTPPRPAPPVDRCPEPLSLPRSPTAWAVGAFLGLVSLMFYVLAAWLPELMQGYGYSPAETGLMVSVLMTIGIPLGFLTPVLAGRLRDQRPLVAAVAAALALGLGGLLLAPGAGWLWVVVLGLANGGAFPLAITLIGLRSPTPAVAARLSGLAQTGGYLLAGLGPLAVGLVHTATGTWTAALLLLLALVLPEAAAGLLAARPGTLRG
ncbi:MFS transporter [Kitasatospora sp. MMS16-BH015]|uniref:MFS transporter n=1 Tax=Kitasatospora sp. MMS16-BH015 TaxID=2018025 RepID=UPI000CA320C7|nr:MFS transporter [Kitasatospora sp. MMS16-BH015]AUG76170.1 MFS transporter [Kitasatospora sp. MMS16-BH015]